MKHVGTAIASLHPPHPERAVVVRGQVFIGGYFYDPFFGPYPWWPRARYPYWYFPIYDNRAEVRLRVQPEEAEQAAIHVDGFYAGIVDDFNGVFQSLDTGHFMVQVPAGKHRVEIRQSGYRQFTADIEVGEGQTVPLNVSLISTSS
jgi:hypothetical protein